MQTALAKGVDLSTMGFAHMSVTCFAVTEVDLTVQNHGPFESHVLMVLGPAVLPTEGDMQGAARGLKASAVAGIAALPAAVLSPASKAALGALLSEVPHPFATATLWLQSKAGFGPTRLIGYAMTGVPASMAAPAPLFGGLTIDIGRTHAPTP